MDTLLASDMTTTKYVIMVGGKPVSRQFDSRTVADQELQKLPPETIKEATIEPVTSGGQQILLG